LCDIYGFGYISSSEVITDSTGLSMTIYYPNIAGYIGSEDNIDIDFTIGISGNTSVDDVDQQINLDISGNINIELDAAFFTF